jgi:hypothetical protein
MKRLVSLSLSILTCICILLASERRAWGYVDPGSGLLALQGIAAAATGFCYFLRRRITGLFVPKRELTKAEVVLPVVVAKEGNSANPA